MDIKYYFVTVTTPFSSGKEYEVGCYINNDIAIKVWHFLQQVNDYKNIEIKIKEYAGQCIVCDAGIRLRDTPNGRITMINHKLDRKEYLRLINIPIHEDNAIDTYLNIDL